MSPCFRTPRTERRIGAPPVAQEGGSATAAREVSTISDTERPRSFAYRFARETTRSSTLKVSLAIYVSYQQMRTYGIGGVGTGQGNPRTPAPSLRRAHLQLVHAEIVRHLVPDGVLHQLRQVLGALGQALMRTLEDGNTVGHGERLENAAGGERPAFVESQQRAPARYAAAP